MPWQNYIHYVSLVKDWPIREVIDFLHYSSETQNGYLETNFDWRM